MSLAAGARLPSERELARQLVVSRSTVVAAYDALRAEGLSRAGRGAAPRRGTARTGSARRADAAQPAVYRSLLDDGDDDVISLACAINPAHPAVGEAIAAVAAEAHQTLLPNSGYLPLGFPNCAPRLAEFHASGGFADDVRNRSS